MFLLLVLMLTSFFTSFYGIYFRRNILSTHPASVGVEVEVELWTTKTGLPSRLPLHILVLKTRSRFVLIIFYYSLITIITTTITIIFGHNYIAVPIFFSFSLTVMFSLLSVSRQIRY